MKDELKLFSQIYFVTLLYGVSEVFFYNMVRERERELTKWKKKNYRSVRRGFDMKIKISISFGI